jgi:hypothetical protein
LPTAQVHRYRIQYLLANRAGLSDMEITKALGLRTGQQPVNTACRPRRVSSLSIVRLEVSGTSEAGADRAPARAGFGL